jgi:hypothetical protein
MPGVVNVLAASVETLATVRSGFAVEQNISINQHADVLSLNPTFNMIQLFSVKESDDYFVNNLFTCSKSDPYFAGKIVARSSHIDEMKIAGDVTQYGDSVIVGKVVEGLSVENLTLTGKASVLDYIAVSPVTSYATSISIPLEVSGTAVSGSSPAISMQASVNSADITINAEVYDQDSVRYEVADIDHGNTDGKIRLFANKWTLCFANKPGNDAGELHTISYFLVEKLVEKYGVDANTMISTIVAKHPETGEEYNYIAQDGYSTPKGSINDFPMCYLKDGSFYPIPFMVQSVSETELEIDWAV